MAKVRGIRRTPTGWQAYVRVGGKLYAKRYPPDTLISTMKAWREDRRVSARTGVALPSLSDTPTFADDVVRYFEIIGQKMPSLPERKHHLAEWSTVFAGRYRRTITPQEIRAQLERWRGAHADSTVNRYRTALMSLYTVLDGKSAANPVRDVPRYHEGEGEPRAQSYGTIYRLLALIRPSKTRARLRVLAWTGWPHAQLKRLKPEHLNWQAQRAYVTPRRKGKGGTGRWLPLLPAAVTALKDFDRWNAWGSFSHSAMHSALQRAVVKLNARRDEYGHRAITMRPYDLRHSFGTMMARLIRDERALQELMLHSTPMQTRRYTEAAVNYRVDQAMQDVLDRLNPTRRVAKKLPARAKPSRRP